MFTYYEGIDWENLRKQQPPIIPEQKHETDTDNFVRMAGKLNEQDKESPFGNTPSDHKTAVRYSNYIKS